MKTDVVTIFDACVDMIVELGDIQIEFDQREKLVKSCSVMLGGSTCIFASQCAKLSLNTSGVGVVGNDAFGQTVLTELKAAAVNTDNIRVRPEVNTAVGIALNKGESRAILTDSSSICLADKKLLPQDFLENARHLHIGSYYLLKGMLPHWAEIAQKAKSLGLTVSLDTNWDPEEKWRLPHELLKNVDYFLPNERELLLITGERDEETAAKSLLGSVKQVIVKKGSKGAILYTTHEKLELPAPPVKVTDTVGAGDSFDAGFVFGRLKGFSHEKTLRTALYCGSMSTRARGGCSSQINLSELNEIK